MNDKLIFIPNCINKIISSEHYNYWSKSLDTTLELINQNLRNHPKFFSGTQVENFWYHENLHSNVISLFGETSSVTTLRYNTMTDKLITFPMMIHKIIHTLDYNVWLKPCWTLNLINQTIKIH